MAWAKIGELALDVLWAVTEALMAGVTAPFWVNVSSMVLIPKGSEAEDECGRAVRAPVAARPIMLSKCDT